jgi:hypothetical protein
MESVYRIPYTDFRCSFSLNSHLKYIFYTACQISGSVYFCRRLYTCSTYSPALKLEAVHSSKMSVNFCHIPCYHKILLWSMQAYCQHEALETSWQQAISISAPTITDILIILTHHISLYDMYLVLWLNLTVINRFRHEEWCLLGCYAMWLL